MAPRAAILGDNLTFDVAGLPAGATLIPPSIDSLILDYQSPNAAPGYYPNEQSLSGNLGGTGDSRPH